MAHLKGQENLELREVSIEIKIARNKLKNAGIDNVQRNPVSLVSWQLQLIDDAMMSDPHSTVSPLGIQADYHKVVRF